MTVHFGILGAGNISETHARAVQEIAGAEIVAVFGQNRGKAERLASLYGGTVDGDLDSFLSHEPMEVVLIGSPSGLHAEQGIAAARRGLHVLVEKPIDITLERADALIRECEQAGVKLGVFFQDRVAPDILKLKQLVGGGHLGKPLLVSASVKWYRPPEYYDRSRWRGTWALDGGGALMNQGVHTVDLLLWLVGDVARVYGKAMTGLHNIEVEDAVVATLEFANGAIGTLVAATSVYPGYPRRLELTGTEGTIILENDRIIAADLRSVSDFEIRTSDFTEGEKARSTSPLISDPCGHRIIIEDFLKAIATGETPVCDGQEARRSVALVAALYESSQTGKAVSIADCGLRNADFGLKK